MFTYGDTKEESEALNGEAHVMVVREHKEFGLAALKRFMSDADIVYRIGGPEPAEPRILERNTDNPGELYHRVELAKAA